MTEPNEKTNMPDEIYVERYDMKEAYTYEVHESRPSDLDTVKYVRAAPDGGKDAIGETSDGYHTFNELYEHRHALFLAVCGAYKDRAWKSKFHSDGSMFDGWFIAGIATTEGQATYHLPLRLWDAFDVEELPAAPLWDGHTADDVIRRISTLSRPHVAEVDFEQAFAQFGDWESEAYSRGVSIDDDDIEKLRLFFDYLSHIGHLAPNQDKIDLSVERQEWCGVAWLCPVSWKRGWNACLDHLAQRYPSKFKGGV